MSLAKRLLIAATVASLSIGAAEAHRAWIVPSTSIVSGDNAYVTFDAAVSNDLFFPDHMPMRVEAIVITAPDGSTVKPENAMLGKYRTTFDLKLDQKGTYRIAQVSSGGGRGGPRPGMTPGGPAPGGQVAGQGGEPPRPAPAPVLGDPNGPYMAQWTEGADTKRWRGTVAEFTAQGIDKKPGVELSTSNRRVETFVTSGKPTPIALTNKGLELAGGTHPNDLYSGEMVSLKFADNGKPAANVKFTIIAGADRYRDDEGAIEVTTDKDGVAKVTFPTAGMYWLSGQSNAAITVDGKAVKSQSSYVAVLEVLPG